MESLCVRPKPQHSTRRTLRSWHLRSFFRLSHGKHSDGHALSPASLKSVARVTFALLSRPPCHATFDGKHQKAFQLSLHCPGSRRRQHTQPIPRAVETTFNATTKLGKSAARQNRHTPIDHRHPGRTAPYPLADFCSLQLTKQSRNSLLSIAMNKTGCCCEEPRREVLPTSLRKRESARRRGGRRALGCAGKRDVGERVRTARTLPGSSPACPRSVGPFRPAPRPCAPHSPDAASRPCPAARF